MKSTQKEYTLLARQQHSLYPLYGIFKACLYECIFSLSISCSFASLISVVYLLKTFQFIGLFPDFKQKSNKWSKFWLSLNKWSTVYSGRDTCYNFLHRRSAQSQRLNMQSKQILCRLQLFILLTIHHLWSLFFVKWQQCARSKDFLHVHNTHTNNCSYWGISLTQHHSLNPYFHHYLSSQTLKNIHNHYRPHLLVSYFCGNIQPFIKIIRKYRYNPH